MSNHVTYSAAKILEGILTRKFEANIFAMPSLARVSAGKVLLGANRSNTPLLMIPVDHVVDNEIEGINLSGSLRLSDRVQLDLEGNEQRFLILSATPDFDLALFGAICDQVIMEIQNDDDYVKMISKIVHSWRELLNSISMSNFSASKAIGLFGELIYLRWIYGEYGQRTLTSWVGPEGARYDFMFPNNALEIKTTTRTETLEIEVHGLDQFGVVEGKVSWIGLSQIEWDPNGISLWDLILDVRALFIDKDLFDSKLKKIGIEQDLEPSLRGFRFSPKSMFVERVTSDFPFLKSDDLATALDLHRLRQFRYLVNLEGLCTKIDKLNEESVVSEICL